MYHFDLLTKKNCSTLQTLKPESQNFLDPDLAKPWSKLDLGFKNTDIG